MSDMSHLTIVFLIHATTSGFIKGNNTLPRPSAFMAVGYDGANDSILLIGDYSYVDYRQFVLFTIQDHSFIDNESYLVPPTNGSRWYPGTQQYTQLGTVLWMMRDDGDPNEQSFIAVDTSSHRPEYQLITTDKAVEDGGCLTSNDHYLFLLGDRSWGGSNYQIYDLQNAQWAPTFLALPGARQKMACIVVNGTLYGIAGSTSGTYLSTTLTLDISVNINNLDWQTLTGRLSEALIGTKAVAYGNDILLIGGENTNGTAVSKVHVIDTQTGDCQVDDTLTLAFAVANAAPIIVRNILFVFGGQISAQGQLTRTDKYQYMVLRTLESTPSPLPIYDEICMSGSAHVPNYNGIYQYFNWSLSRQGAIYKLQHANMYLYPWIYPRLLNHSDHSYLIGVDPTANAAYGYSTLDNKSTGYMFDIAEYFHANWVYFDNAWVADTNLIMNVCGTHNPLTSDPTTAPSANPSGSPSRYPTSGPSESPSSDPSKSPIASNPSSAPGVSTSQPTVYPSTNPSRYPSFSPIASTPMPSVPPTIVEIATNYTISIVFHHCEQDEDIQCDINKTTITNAILVAYIDYNTQILNTDIMNNEVIVILSVQMDKQNALIGETISDSIEKELEDEYGDGIGVTVKETNDTEDVHDEPTKANDGTLSTILVITAVVVAVAIALVIYRVRFSHPKRVRNDQTMVQKALEQDPAVNVVNNHEKASDSGLKTTITGFGKTNSGNDESQVEMGYTDEGGHIGNVNRNVDHEIQIEMAYTVEGPRQYKREANTTGAGVTITETANGDAMDDI
eukprot:605172_1